MRQKFPAYSFVKVEKDGAFFEGIIEGTYSQLYGGDGDNLKQYSLYKMVDGEVVDKMAWFDEGMLSLMPEQDYLKAQEIVETYNIRE